MSRVAFVADVHVASHKRFGGPIACSINRRARMILKVLADAANTALDSGCEALVVLGDLFDTERPEPQLVAAVQEIFADVRSQGLDVSLLLGNHEMVSSIEGDHSLAPLAPCVSGIIERPTAVRLCDAWLGLVPFRTGKAIDWFEDSVEEAFRCAGANVPRVLGFHLGIRDEKTPPWLRSAEDSIGIEELAPIADRFRIRVMLAGNWHERRAFRIHINDPPPLRSRSSASVLQVGALCPSGFDNPGLDGYGTVAIWDSERPLETSWIVLPGPRFMKARSCDALDLSGSNQLFVSVTAPPAEVAEHARALADLESKGRIAGWEVLPDGAEAEGAAREAAAEARAASNVERAVETFVERIALEEGVDRATVARIVKGYLK